MADTDTKGWVVKCPLAQLHLANDEEGNDGGYAHFYKGAKVPELYEGDAELLHDQGLIGPADEEFVPVDKTDPERDKQSRQGLGKWVKQGDAKASAEETPQPEPEPTPQPEPSPSRRR